MIFFLYMNMIPFFVHKSSVEHYQSICLLTATSTLEAYWEVI